MTGKRAWYDESDKFFLRKSAVNDYIIIGETKRLTPIGTYVPKDKNVAVFHIDGLSQEEAKAVPEIRAPYDTDVYCVTCNKTIHVKAGEVVPSCCGRLMEILD